MSTIEEAAITLPAQREPTTTTVRQTDEGVSVASMLHHAISNNVPVESLERLVALQERVLDREAVAGFNRDMAELQAEIGPIAKNRTVQGSFSYDYATYDYIADRLSPFCRRYGFSYSFDSEWMHEGSKAYLKVWCKVRHRDGHSETTHFQAPVDAGARMNDTQKSGSALSYGKRYSLMAAFGLSIGAGAEDDDGRRGGAQPVTPEQADEIKNLLHETGSDVAAFLKWLGADSVDTIPATRYQSAVAAIKKKAKA